MPKNKLGTKRKSINHPSLQEIKMKSDVLTSSKRWLKLIYVERSINNIFGRIFSIDLCRLETAVDSTPPLSIQEQKYAVYRSLPVLKSGTVFADCLKCHFSISFSEEMVGLFDFFLYVGHF